MLLQPQTVVSPQAAAPLPVTPSIPWEDVQKAGLVCQKLFGAGQLICKEGEPGDSMFFIETGAVFFYTHDAEGKQMALRTLRTGEFFGEIALLLGEARSVNARAQSEVFAFELRREHFGAFLDAYPEMRDRMLREMAGRLKTNADMLRDSVLPDVAREIEATRTPAEQQVQEAVGGIGSLGFLGGITVVLAAWLAGRFFWKWDENLVWIALTVSTLSLLLTILILVKQNRDEADSDFRANRILRNTGTNGLEVRRLREEMGALTAALRTANATPMPVNGAPTVKGTDEGHGEKESGNDGAKR